jgi:hypothetical protein
MFNLYVTNVILKRAGQDYFGDTSDNTALYNEIPVYTVYILPPVLVTIDGGLIGE